MPPPPESTPARVPIAVDGGRAVVVVECPDHMFQRTLRTSEELNLNEVLAQIVKKNPFPVPLILTPWESLYHQICC